MDLNFSLCFAVLLVLLVSIASAQDNDTKGPLLYTVQPVSQYSCNPHSNGSIQLVCALYQHGGLTNHTIRWFRSSNNCSNIVNEANARNEEYLVSIFYLNNSIEADYWCQAGTFGEDNSTYEPSAVFKVLPPDAYIGYPPCTGLFLSQQVTMFAGNGSILPPVGDDTPTTVGPSPSQNISGVLIAGVVISSFFVALLSLLICIFCCVLRSKRKLSTEIDIIHSTNEPLQSLTTIDIHGNEPTTPPQEMENSAGYVDVGAEEIPPLDHPLRTSLANGMDSAHLQDNAIEIYYHAIDADGMDTNDYTNLRKPPPISPKPRRVKPQSVNCQREFAVTRIGDGKTSKQCRKPLPPPKNEDKNRATLKDESLLQSHQPCEQEYQELSSSTKNRVDMYTCPAEVSASSESIVYAN